MGLASPPNVTCGGHHAWTTEPGWNTELQLRNNLDSSDLTVVPAVRTANGVETALPGVTIKAGDVVSVDLSDALMKSAPSLVGAWGSLVLRYTSVAHRALYCAVMVRGDGRPIAFHLDANERGSKYELGSREGIWWLPWTSVTDYLILTNTGDQVLQPNLVLFDSSGNPWQQKLSLGAFQTKRLSIRSLLQQAGLNGSYGGFRIDLAVGARYLDSTHLLFDESGGFSAIMKMFKHDPGIALSSRAFGGVTEWTTRAPMLALSNPDPALGFPAGTALQPKVFIRNASGKTVTVHLRFNWRSAAASGKSAPLDLAFNANETQVVDVAALQAQKLLPADAYWASVILSASVMPDELLAVAASYDQTGHLGAQTPFSDQLATHWEAGKWEVDSLHNSLVTIANGGNSPARAQLTILYNQGASQYQVEQALAPDEQMVLDFGKLIRNQVPDKNGHTLPTGLTGGTYRLLDLNANPTGSLYEGKVIVDKTYGHASYGCMICCGPNNPYMLYDPLAVAAGGSQVQVIQAVNSCNGHLVTVTGDFPTWWTDSTSIATATASAYRINGISFGTTNHNAQSVNMYWGPKEDAPSCDLSQEEPSAPTNVGTLSCPSSVVRAANASCSVSNAPSGATFSGWKFTDSNDNTVTSNNTNSSWSGTMVTSGTVSVTVSTNSGQTPLSASITVTNRNWHTSPASPAEVPNGTFIILPEPPQAGGSDSGLGYFKWTASYNGLSYSTISDSGPNQGYTYWPSNLSFSTFNFQYEINPDLENSSSTFSQHQCGNYNATSDPNGFVSWSNLLAQTQRHEYNSAVQSHYGFYLNSLNSNNPGDYLEPQIARPGANLSQFTSNTQSGINNLLSTVSSASQVEPYPVNYSEVGTFLGNINYAPYTSCN